MAGLGSRRIQDRLINVAQASGYFESVNGAAPENRVTSGLHCAVEFAELAPARGESGLDATTVRMVWTMGVFTPLDGKDQEDIDPDALDAVDDLFATLSGGFELGGSARNIDLLGKSGVALSVKAGYVTVGGQKCRALMIVIPMIINDVWGQSR